MNHCRARLLIATASLGLTLLCGCLTGFSVGESLGDELLCSCGAMVIRCGAMPDPYVWYVCCRPYAYAENIYVEWRWLEDERTHETFFSFANDMADTKQRRQGISRFHTYEEMVQRVALAIRSEMNRPGTSWTSDAMQFFMCQKIGFPENSKLSFNEYCDEQLRRYSPIGYNLPMDGKYSHDGVVEAIPGFVQRYYGQSDSAGSMPGYTAYIVRKDVSGYETRSWNIEGGAADGND